MLSVIKLCKTLYHAGCVLAHIPSLVGMAAVWAAVLRKEYPRDAYRSYSLQHLIKTTNQLSSDKTNNIEFLSHICACYRNKKLKKDAAEQFNLHSP